MMFFPSVGARCYGRKYMRGSAKMQPKIDSLVVMRIVKKFIDAIGAEKYKLMSIPRSRSHWEQTVKTAWFRLLIHTSFK